MTTLQNVIPLRSPPSVDTVLDLALVEIHDRLKDDELRAKIPDHVLKTYLVEANKVADRRREQESQQDGVVVDVLEIIQQSTMTDERRAELLGAEIRKTKDRLGLLVEALGRVDG